MTESSALKRTKVCDDDGGGDDVRTISQVFYLCCVKSSSCSIFCDLVGSVHKSHIFSLSLQILTLRWMSV